MAEVYNVISYKNAQLAKRILNESLLGKVHVQTSSMPHKPRTTGGGRDTYKGYFKVIDSSTPAVPASEGVPAEDAVIKVKIVDGYDNTLTKAGYATINDTVFDVDVAELTITAKSFIYIQAIATLNTETGVYDTAIPTFEQSATYPTWETLKFKRLICVVNFAGGKITDIVQQNYGDILGYSNEACVE